MYNDGLSDTLKVELVDDLIIIKNELNSLGDIYGQLFVLMKNNLMIDGNVFDGDKINSSKGGLNKVKDEVSSILSSLR